LLYDDSRELSTQHLGVTFEVLLESAEYEIGERGFLMDDKFETLEEIESHIYDFENWSALIATTEKNREF
jgi:predicted NUDIX family phosphoesterase